MSRVVPVQFLTKLRQLLPNPQITLGESACVQHSADEGGKRILQTSAVCFPKTKYEVSDILKLCSEYQVPVFPYGTGTGLEGGICPTVNGITVNLSQMETIKSINTDDFDATVEAGVTRKGLNRELAPTGLMFPIDPGADSSLGGMAATSASGTNAVRYGTMRENILNMEVVLANGKIIKTAGSSRAKKTSAGYNLTNLFVGSEGTLGIITEVTLRLHPQPSYTNVASCYFNSVKEAIETVINIKKMAIPIARVEFLDDSMMKAVNSFSKVDYPVKPGTLMFEFHGSSEVELGEQVEMVKQISQENNCVEWAWASSPEDRAKLWAARHNAYYASKSLRKNCSSIITDVCVPISKLADIIVDTKEQLNNSSLPSTIVGHVGDGNFHVIMLYDDKNPKEVEEKERIYNRMIDKAIEMEGTCTGEHGIGLGKRKHLLKQAGVDAIDAMRSIKNSLDPFNIMNPSKIFE